MEQLSKEDTLVRKEEIISAIKKGALFIYPTDTIYGIGCDATNTSSVEKIRELKKREEKPFSVIVPNKGWIEEVCGHIDENRLSLLPGPYTFFLPLIDKEAVAKNVSGGESLGVRIPDHWFTKIVQESGAPFITTSVNVTNEPHMERVEDVPQEILNEVDFVVYEGPIVGESSKKIDLRN